jgi:plastocyanin
VTVVSGPQRFHSPDQSTGTFTRTLRRAGRYTIVCTIHGQMMRIRVR